MLTLAVAIILTVYTATAQQPANPNGISVNYLLVDYTSPFIGNSPFKAVKVYDFENLGNGGEIKYTRLINDYFAVGVPFKLALVNLPDSVTGFTDKELVLSLDGLLKFGYLKNESRLKPYLFSGFGINMDGPENDINLQIPLGLGLNVRLTNQLHLQIQTEYRHSLGENRNNWQHGAGLLYMFGGGEGASGKGKSGKSKITDQDGDGIPDNQDNCPDSPGVAAFAGCPDSDNDGISDFEDDCPGLAGERLLNGCPDTDGDNVSDRDDDCPDAPGTAETKGCPDADLDGVADPLDACPDAAGPPENNGCPLEIADADNDGVADSEDECPNQAGFQRFAGCPDIDNDGVPDKDDPCPNAGGRLNGCPDTDGDGIADDADRCPTVPGVVGNNGCPEVAPTRTEPTQTEPVKVITKEDKATLERAMYAVRFETGNGKMKAESFDILDQIASVMNRYPGSFLKISGHTDSIGSSKDNQKLSEKRAKSCYVYLVGKGVHSARMQYVGYGEKEPIATNKYKHGREQNRRVEFELTP